MQFGGVRFEPNPTEPSQEKHTLAKPSLAWPSQSMVIASYDCFSEINGHCRILFGVRFRFRFGSVRFGEVRWGSVGLIVLDRFSSVGFDLVRFDGVLIIWFNSVGFGSIWLGGVSSVWFGSIRWGSVWCDGFGLVYFNGVWFGSIGFGSVRLSLVQYGSIRFGSN
ncbi:hypothetical protein BHE74_00054130 [Ensete ventricosum]|nr:hypothetical protein BHE74_00054130 [Ensete ventricosum]